MSAKRRRRAGNDLAAGAQEAYRFTHCSGPARSTILVSRTGDERIIEARQSYLFPEHWWGRQLYLSEWKDFKAPFDRADFWSMPDEFPQFGLDGFTWNIAAHCGERRHSSSCWSPHDGSFFELGMCFVRLAGVELVYYQP